MLFAKLLFFRHIAIIDRQEYFFRIKYVLLYSSTAHADKH